MILASVDVPSLNWKLQFGSKIIFLILSSLLHLGGILPSRLSSISLSIYPSVFYLITSSKFSMLKLYQKQRVRSIHLGSCLESLGTSLLSGTINMKASTLCFSYLRIAFFSLRMIFRNQCLHARCVHCYWSDIVLKSFQWS